MLGKLVLPHLPIMTLNALRLLPLPEYHALCPCRNGPGQFELGGQKVYHPFDGHGIISSVSIRNGRAFYRSKFVRSHE